MKPHHNGAPDIRKLLGGYATGTLTDEERRALFEAALQDQSLFDELIDEEAFREALAEPGAKGRLLEALEPRRAGFWDRLPRWLAGPQGWGLAGAVVTTVVLAGLFIRGNRPEPQMAVNVPVATPQPAPQPAAAPESLEKRPSPPPARLPSLARKRLATREEGVVNAPQTESKKELAIATGAVAPAEPSRREAEPVTVLPPAPPPQQPPAPFVQQGQLNQSKQAFSDVRPQMAAAPAPVQRILPAPAVRYTVFRKPAAGQSFASVAADTLLQPGDEVRLDLTVTQAGYLHVLRKASDRYRRASANSLFPAVPGRSYTFPSSGGILIEESVEAPSFMVVYTRTPELLPEEIGEAGVIGGAPGFRAAKASAERDAVARPVVPPERATVEINLRKR